MSDTDSHSGRCEKCGAPLAGDAAGGLCPRCLMALNLATETEMPGETGPHGTKVVPSPPTSGEIAALFPHLEILECLGRGGMGVVYKARQPKLNRLVALKLLAPEKGADAKFAERFTREAQALARLSHPNIVTVYDFGEAGGHYYLLMEFVNGLSLRELLRSRKLAPEEALAIVPRICEALQYAHEQGIVHRDIKPENILLDKHGRLKIADFGIAKIINPISLSEGERTGAKGESLTQDQVIGTPHYMAPEQIEHPLQVDHRADIYSLGVVFYEMLTGELPLGKFAPPSKKVQVDVRLDEVVLHTLEKEPERRYQHASQVKTDVETIAATARSSGREPTPVGDQREGTTATARSNAKEAFIVFAGTIVFALLLSVVVELSHASVVPLRGFLFGVCVVGLIICALSLAGFWPFPSPWFPEPNFSSRNLRRRRSSSASAPDPRPRFSRAAIVGAFWPLLLPLGLLLNQIAAVTIVRSEPHTIWMTLSGISGMLLIALGELSIVGTTILGWIAVSQIRRSSGRLYGLGLAVFDGLLFPLLALDGLIAGGFILGYGLFSPEIPFGVPPHWKADLVLIILAAVAVAGVVDFLIVRQVWGAVKQPLNDGQTRPVAAAPPGQSQPPRFGSGWKLAAALSIVAAIILAFLTGAVLVANYLPRRSSGLPYPAVRYTPGQSSVAAANVQPPTVSASSPAAFGPVIERVVAGEGDANRRFIDFDTGRLFAAAEFFGPKAELSPEETQAWWRETGTDAMGDTSPAVRGLIGFDMSAVPVPNVEWNRATPARLDYYLTLAKAGTPVTMSGKGALPATFVIQTREGGRGLLQITGFTNSSPGVIIRYKLVPPATGTKPPARQENLIYQTASVTRGALSQVVAATGTLDPLATDARQWRIEASVNEADVVGVEAGQNVRFTLDAFPRRTFTGKVLEVGSTPVRQDNTVNYIARISANNPDPKFKPGMTASVAFIVAHRENVLLVPNAALVRTNDPNARIVYVMRAGEIELSKGASFMIGRPEAVRIRIGISDGVSTEVIEGLHEGDRVVIGARKVEISPTRNAEGLKEGNRAETGLTKSPQTVPKESSMVTAPPGESSRWSGGATVDPSVTQ